MIMARQKLRDYEMDEMEILYYMRQEARNKAYKAKQKKTVHKNKTSAKRKRTEDDSATFERMIRESLYYDMESVC